MRQDTFRVVEHFISINGEGRRAGQLAHFIRFAGCNLQCEYCDTKWANAADVKYTEQTADEICTWIREAGIRNVTLTGGEPLLQSCMRELLQKLRQMNGYRIEIETNGSVDICRYMELSQQADPVSFTLDYKLSVSGMEEHMYLPNYEHVREQDTVKFVAGSRADLEKSAQIIRRYRLTEKGCGIYLSPCFGKIDPADMVAFLAEEKLNDVNIQLQLHKYIWDPEQRGV